MLFSSLSFLFYFFPFVILIHYFLPQKLQNVFLFLASLVFYAWGEIRYLHLFFLLLMLDWAVGVLLARTERPALRRLLLAAGVVGNMGALLYYKYSGFLAGALGLTGLIPVSDTLPLGISFFTFQAVGYMVDVYRREIEPERNVFAFGTFIFMFPQLIAGPIIRYSETRQALHSRRRPDGAQMDAGMAVFVAGLAAKVLLANALGAMSEELYGQGGDSLSALVFMFTYGFQLYFDFLGYSVMAIGMGRMLGFSFPRNFNHPYASSSITDLWRRWHITLASWFRDYVYIPLGGSRKGKIRTIINTLLVWALTGFWHGAGWNFIVWGLWYFLALMVDRYLLRNRPFSKPVRRIWFFVSVVLGQVIFRTHSLAEAGQVYGALFSFRYTGAVWFWLRENAVLLVIATALCVPAVVEGLKAFLRKHRAVRCAAMVALLALCLISLAESSYNPFLYFHF